VGLGLSCPEAARIILGSSEYGSFEELGSVDVPADGVEFDGRGERGRLYVLLGDPSQDYCARLEQISRLYSVKRYEDSRWLEVLASLEYLDEDHKKIFLRYSSAYRPEGADEVLERFLLVCNPGHCFN
jgi:hypothetical protein